MSSALLTGLFIKKSLRHFVKIHLFLHLTSNRYTSCNFFFFFEKKINNLKLTETSVFSSTYREQVSTHLPRKKANYTICIIMKQVFIVTI